jgi:hypothetical protein
MADRNGSPLTGAAKITERFHRVDHGNLEVMLTVDDPKAYTAPWTIKLNQVLVTDSPDLLDYNCTENEQMRLISPANKQATASFLTSSKSLRTICARVADCLVKCMVRTALDNETHKDSLTRFSWIDRSHGVWNFFRHGRDFGFLRPHKTR